MNKLLQRIVVMLTALAIGLAGLLAVGAPASAASSDLYSMLNQSRFDAGLKGLARDSRLDKVAQDWTNYMARTGTLAHNPSYSEQIPAGWYAAGENVGWNSQGDAALHAALMASPKHKANILSGEYNSVGIGWAKDSKGYVWGTHVFAFYPGVKMIEPGFAPGVTPDARTLLAVRSSASSAQLRQITSTGVGGVEDLGGVITGDPDVINRNGKLEVYARGTNGRIYVRVGAPGAWEAWKAISQTTVSSRPDVVVTGSTVDVFVRDNAGSVSSLRSSAPGSYGSWVPVGGRLQAGSAPTVTKMANGSVQLAAVGTDGAVYTRPIGSGRWSNLGGRVRGDLSSTTTSGGVAYLVVRGTDDRAYSKVLGVTSGWTSLGGVLVSSPTASLDSGGRPVTVVPGIGGWYRKVLNPASGWVRVL